MYYTGFADEAGKSIDRQIKATLTLGWRNIEARKINGKNISQLEDDEFEIVCDKLESAGIRINCFGSTVANWGKDPRSKIDYEKSIAELKRAIPRMRKLGTKMIRGMSFAIVKDMEPDDPDLEKIIFEKLRHLVSLCAEAGILYLHENCMNYGGMSHEHTLKLLAAVNNPHFKLVFDTGNPVMIHRRIGKKPYPKQDPWEFYRAVKDHIHYVHIKDCLFEREVDGAIFPQARFTFPGEGDGKVREIVSDLLASGYDGGFSIEPHMAVQFHNTKGTEDDHLLFQNYVEYGQRFMKLVEEIMASQNISTEQ